MHSLYANTLRYGTPRHGDPCMRVTPIKAFGDAWRCYLHGQMRKFWFTEEY